MISYKIIWGMIIGLSVLLGNLKKIIVFFKDVIAFSRRPRLKLLYFKQGLWTSERGVTREVITAEVKNLGSREAKGCLATAKVVKAPTTNQSVAPEVHLHWADVTYNLRTTGADQVNIPGKVVWRLDVVFRPTGHPPTQGGMEIPFAGLSPGFFSPVSLPVEGCWLAIGLALSDPGGARQFHLRPGEYELDIEVTCENGRGDSKTIRFVSPAGGESIKVLYPPLGPQPDRPRWLKLKAGILKRRRELTEVDRS